MYLTTVKELGTALLTKGTAFALTQTATQTNNSSVNDVLDSAQEVTASTADEVNRFVQYFNDNIPNLIAFGLKVIFAIVFYLIGSKVISVIRKVVGKSMERSNADVGVRQFVDSMLKFGLYALLVLLLHLSDCYLSEYCLAQQSSYYRLLSSLYRRSELPLQFLRFPLNSQ